MSKKTIIILVIAVIVCSFIILTSFKSNLTGFAVSNSLFENSDNYLDAGDVEERFRNYLSLSKHTAKHDILWNPMLFNGYEVVIAGTYQKQTIAGEYVGVLTDYLDYAVVLIKNPNTFIEGKHYELTGIVHVIEYCENNECELIPLVEVKESHEGFDLSNISDYYDRDIPKLTKK